MNTLILQEPGRLEFTQTDQPGEPGPGEAAVRVHHVGICGTDIHAYGGNQPFFEYPRILGHELGVEVTAVGEGVTNVKAGDKCAVEPYLYCGECAACVRGKTNCCGNITVLGVHGDGGMREHFVLPASTLHPSAKLPLESLALVETLGIGKHAVSRARLEAGDTVAVIGLGPIGLTAIQFALLDGAKVVGIDLSEKRLATAKQLYPEIETLSLNTEVPLEEQWEATLGELPRAVFDATGNRHSMQAAFKLPGQGGTLVFIGLLMGDISFDDPSFHRKELTLMGSRNSTAQDFREIIEHMEAGRIDVAPWITHRTTAQELPGIFEDWLKPEAAMLKGVVSF
ncbi:zinc-binding alcohol dehydrogenase family protein [Algisphaera agarilytica]|uniref:Threonine dehydrogenase-like Zn-dependent dehydrogenase n=1 Tax=Algisphaera agarilytica TaxID=1385975 RepID=A0A7X0H3J8_9BACT|nr:zinc-binding alcohol dehydrogenase family protein [Algisphaera agarilytica]MBB6428637.1 threonine dehydrogenase-like Zn-dependent dehydrogenase [Algisphaera agarilytica]